MSDAPASPVVETAPDAEVEVTPPPRLAYLFSRYPVVSHTFCDNEILGLEAAGWELVVGALYPPKNEFRHERLDHLRAPVLYPPPPEVLRVLESQARETGRWPAEMIARHQEQFGESTQPVVRCRNALLLAERLERFGVDHVHLHFANRATHTAIFLKALAGIPYSFTPQAADFLIDLENPELLAEFCREAEFVVAPCDYAQEKLAELCPDSADKLVRIYNGIDPGGYTLAQPKPEKKTLRVVSVGRMIEFKGFHHLIAAVALAQKQGVWVELELMGDGPWRERLENQVDELLIRDRVTFRGTVGLDEMKAAFGTNDAFALACTASEDGAMDMFPTVITEAMLSGLPVVSSRVAGVPELVIGGDTGFLTEPGDEEALAEALVRLGSEPGLAAGQGAQGRKRAERIFARDVTLSQLAHQFEFVAQTRKPAPASPRFVAFYDLSREKTRERFALEKTVIESLGGSCWLSAGGVDPRELEKLGPLLQGVDWLPDGMVLEMEWRSRKSQRQQLESLRTELSTSVDGETFLEASRRAVWWSEALARRGGIEMIYAPGAPEGLMAWLVHQLSDTPFVSAIEREGVYAGKLRKRLFADARSVAIDTHSDPLLRKPLPRPVYRIGPLRWKGKVPIRPAIERREALRSWLKAGL